MTPGGDFEYLMHYYFQMFTQTPEMKRIKSGYLLKEILDRFTNKTQSTLSPDRSLWLYFAHDITITNMLNSLGLFKVQITCYMQLPQSKEPFPLNNFICSFINLRIHRVCSLNCTKQMTIVTMFNFSTKIPRQPIYQRYISPIAVKSAHWKNCTSYIMTLSQRKVSKKNANYAMAKYCPSVEF